MLTGIIDSGQKIITDGLVLHLDAAQLRSYPGNGTTWTDLSGNNNNASLINGAAYNSANGGNIAFDGVNDYVDLGTFTGFGSGDRTVEVWFQILSLPDSPFDRVITFVLDNTSTDTPYFTIAYPNTNTYFIVGIGGSPYDGYIYFPAFSLSTWMCVTCTISGNVVTGYRNGSLIGTATNTGSVATNPICYIARYNSHYGQYGNIRVANVKTYNRVLSGTEVLQNYNATKSRFGL